MPHNRRSPKPHGPHVSPDTDRRRSIERIVGRKKRRVKQLRDLDWTYEEIADALHVSAEQVADALGNSRAPNPSSPNANIYTRKPTKDRFRRHVLPEETENDALHRILDEYENLLRLLAGRNRTQASVSSLVQ